MIQIVYLMRSFSLLDIRHGGVLWIWLIYALLV